MMHPVSWNMARLLRRIRRRDMKIGKLKRELRKLRRRQRKLRRRQRKMEEERKAVITVAENGGIDVEIEFFPDAGRVGICGELAAIGFGAIVQAYGRFKDEEQDED